MTIHTIPRVNTFLKRKERYANATKSVLHAHAGPTTGYHSKDRDRDRDRLSVTEALWSLRESHSNTHTAPCRDRDRDRGHRRSVIRKIKVYMYNFGSPRVFNRNLARIYDKLVPNSYRVIVDGDVVPSLPIGRLGYHHVGTQILIDSVGAGSVIIDPSFVEWWLRTKTKASVAAHSLLGYRKGLLGLKLAAEVTKDVDKDTLDPIQIVLEVRVM